MVDPQTRLRLLASATQRAPTTEDEGLSLARLLVLEGQPATAVELLQTLGERFPQNAAIEVQKAHAFVHLKDRARGLAACSAALALAGTMEQRAEVELELPLLAERLGGWADAAGLAEALLHLPPICFSRLYRDARVLDELDAFVRACDAVLERVPGHTDAIYQKGLALGRLGHNDAARALIRPDEMLIQDIQPPSDFADLAAFLAGLEREIRANPTLAPDRKGQATRHAVRTQGQLRRKGDVAIPRLLDLIHRHCTAYIAAYPALTDYLGKKPSRLDAWALIYGAEGRQRSHRHPQGVVSGVFYVASPTQDDGLHAGPLLVGAVEEEDGRAPWGAKIVEPRPGRIVVFPSYMPHATEASSCVGQDRIVIAFDLALD